jgi:membrane fusion protein, multidrug efflux system
MGISIIIINNPLVINFRPLQASMMPSIRFSATVLLLAALTACSRPAPSPEPVRAVKLQRVSDGTVQAADEFAAEIRARTESRLGFRVAGKLLQRPAEVGQMVRAGQLLAVIDPQDYQLGLQAAQAQVSAAQTQRDLAAADLRRYESLRDQGFVSGAEIERRQATLQGAEAALTQARAAAGVQGNQAAYTRLLADADGVVVAVEAEPGQVLATGVAVVRLAHQGPRDVVLSVPEDRVAGVRVGQTALVTLGPQGGPSASPMEGTVREVAAAADPATRTFMVKVALPSRAVQPPLGATATVRLSLSGAAQAAAAGVIRLPSAALWKQGQGSAVWVLDGAESKVRARTVEVAGLDGQDVLIRSGLKPGEDVVVAGVHVLGEGQAVTRYRETPPPAPAPSTQAPPVAPR